MQELYCQFCKEKHQVADKYNNSVETVSYCSLEVNAWSEYT